MKKLKHRAWDKTRKEMNYKILVGNTDIDDKKLYLQPNSCRGKWVHADEVCVDIMEFIGLQDKNGKDIYEGDIVKLVYIPLGSDPDVIEWYKIGVFVHKHNYFGIAYKIEGTTILDESRKMYHHETRRKKYVHPTQGENWVDKSPTLSQAEVIGNIYENDNLLTP